MERVVREVRRDPDLARIPQYRAKDLTGDGKQAEIELDGKVYSLRITRAGKLILTK
ncbi:hemin uptake protein HemP [Pseudooceanicola onchidii]|uniref:hemin uptake protein HemP n=1 Tax=Pseudooceanicola onchidii TaxID=2562279 RepID=UPI0010AAE6B6|nr:hemin uptake protein HemP [Pseudooceanicola onchidii]